MTKMERWSREEDEILLQNYPEKSIADLKALLPNRSYYAIEHRIRLLRKRGLIKAEREKPKKVDREKFIELWNSGASVDEIAEVFGVSKSHVHFLRKRFGLEGRRSTKKHEATFKVLSFLKEHGYCELAHLTQHVSKHSINKLVEEGAVYKVSLEGRMGGGRKRHVKFCQIVRPEFARKTYICLNRTAIVRLLSHALMKPENSGVVRATTLFLKSLDLTAAETEAVLQMLKRKVI